MEVIVFVSTKDLRFENYIVCGLFEFLPWPNPILLSESQGQRSIAVKVGDNGQRSNLLHIHVYCHRVVHANLGDLSLSIKFWPFSLICNTYNKEIIIDLKGQG